VKSGFKQTLGLCLTLVFTSILKPAFQFKLFNNVGENRIFVLVKKLGLDLFFFEFLKDHSH